MERKAKIVVLGDILYDCFVWADRLPKEGETVTGYANGFFSGGKGANQAVQAAKLGAEVYLIGRVGHDGSGRFLLEKLNGYGVNTQFVKVDDIIATGTCCVHVADQGKNAIVVAPLANEAVELCDVEAAREMIESADVFITQLQLPSAVVRRGLEIATEAGILTVFDPAPLREIDDALFAMADYITPNETEAEFYTQLPLKNLDMNPWCEKAAKTFHQRGVKQVLLTLGAKGVYFSGQERFHEPCLKMDAIDTTGAGDSFTGAFALALAEGKEIREAIHFACCAAALTTTKKGSQPAMPDFLALNQYIASL